MAGVGRGTWENAASRRRGGGAGKNVVVFSSRLKIPREAAHEKSRIARHKVNVVDAAGLITQS